MFVLIKRKLDGPSVPELGTPTSTSYESVTVPLNRPSTGPSALASYELQRSLNGSTWTSIATGPGIFGNPAAQYVDGGRSALTTYYYRARATDAAGRVSDFCAPVSVTTADRPVGPPPPPPTAEDWRPNFPVLGGAYPTAPEFVNRANWARYARMSFCFVPWHPDSDSYLGPLATACEGIQKLAPASVGATPIHAVYVIHQEGYSPFRDAPWYADITKKLQDENWWLRETHPDGALIDSGFGSNIEINNTGFAHDNAKDANGKSWLIWHAEHSYKLCITGGVFQFPNGVTHTVNPNSFLGAYYIDNVFGQKRKGGDYDRNGSYNDPNEAAFRASVQRGYRIHCDRLRELSPTIKITGNIDFYTVQGGSMYQDNWEPDYSKHGELHMAFDGAWVEQFLSDEGVAYEWATRDYTLDNPDRDKRGNPLMGFWAARNSMRLLHNSVRNPRMNMFNVQDVRHNGTAEDNQRLRFAIAFVCVCSNGMIHDGGEGSQAHKSGFSVKNGSLHPYYTNNGAGHGWLGQPVNETPSWQPYQNGVYLREFTNGFCAVNPRNNGARTIAIGANVRNIANGATYAAGQSIPIADRDGLLLLKI